MTPAPKIARAAKVPSAILSVAFTAGRNPVPEGRASAERRAALIRFSQHCPDRFQQLEVELRIAAAAEAFDDEFGRGAAGAGGEAFDIAGGGFDLAVDEAAVVRMCQGNGKAGAADDDEGNGRNGAGFLEGEAQGPPAGIE